MALTPGSYAHELTETDHFATTPASEPAARGQFQEMFDNILSIHNASLLEIEAAMAALVLTALGLSPGCINNPNLFAAGVVNDAALATDVKVGSLALLTTAAKSSVQAAVNELVTKTGTLATLSTTEKTNLVGAVNELYSRLVTTAMITDAAVTAAKLGTDVPRITSGADDTAMPDVEDCPEGTIYWWPED